MAAKRRRVEARQDKTALQRRAPSCYGSSVAVSRAILIASLLLYSSVAEAEYRLPGPTENPTEQELARAREAFVRGTELTEEARWADALEQFELAYALSAIPAALFNAASTLRALGRHRDARDAFSQLLEDDRLDERTRTEAQRRFAEEADRVARLILIGIPSDTQVEFFLDGIEESPAATDPYQIETDPGEHTLRIVADDYEPWSWSDPVEDGEARRIEVALTALPPESTDTSLLLGGPASETRRPLRRSPWLWATVGIAVVAGIATTVILVRNTGLDTSSGFDRVELP